MSDVRTALLAALLLVPVAVVSADSNLSPPDPAPVPTPTTDVVNVANCLPTGMEVPLAVDECGDTMTGNLAFAPTRGVAFPAGTLTGDGQLVFAGTAVCRAGVVITGCAGGDITGVIAGAGLVGGGLSGDVTLSADTSFLQRRVAAACVPGASIRAIDAIGGVTCEADDNSGGTVTSVGSGAGLTGGPITASGTLSVATGGISNAMLASNAVTGAKIDPATTITASNYFYSTARSGSYFADPSLCVRGTSGGEPDADMQVFNSPANAFGPGVSLLGSAPAGLYNFVCPLILPIPAGATLTITGGDMGYFDNSASCLVGATIRSKVPFTVSSGGALFATVYDGTGPTDYAFTNGNPASKSFVTSSAVNGSSALWIQGIIDQTASGSGCRFLGMLIDYTVTQA